MLLVILALSILLIIISSIRYKINAFVTLLGACFFLAFATGMPLEKALKSIQTGMGDTLGFLAPILALGAILGKLLEISGGAERLARTLIAALGRKNAAWAMLMVAYICGIPVFFQVGIVLLIGLVFCVAQEAKLPVMQVGLSMIAGLITVHCIVPPHPAAMAVTLALKADVGRVIIYGLVVGLPAAALAGPIWGKLAAKGRDFLPPAKYCQEPTPDESLPPFASTLGMILLPLLLMILKTVFELNAPKGHAWTAAINFIGNPMTALFISAMLAYLVLGKARGFTWGDLAKHTEQCLGPMATIIMVIGAAGSFNRVILDSGIGQSLEQILTALRLNPLVLAWSMAIIMRFAIGSATVAMMTAAGFITPLLGAHPHLDPALLAVAIGAGAIGGSHVTDPGFWFVKEYLGIPMKQMFTTYSLSTCIAAVTALIGVLILARFIN